MTTKECGRRPQPATVASSFWARTMGCRCEVGGNSTAPQQRSAGPVLAVAFFLLGRSELEFAKCWVPQFDLWTVNFV